MIEPPHEPLAGATLIFLGGPLVDSSSSHKEHVKLFNITIKYNFLKEKEQ